MSNSYGEFKLFVKNLPFKISGEELYDLFGRHGAIRQIRVGTTTGTRGTAYVVYHDAHDAKSAVDRLSGFNVQGRYLVVGYHKPSRAAAKRQRGDGRGGAGVPP